jgi:hypothetical protein
MRATPRWVQRPDRTGRNNDTPVDVPSNTNFAPTPCGFDMLRLSVTFAIGWRLRDILSKS